MTHVASAPVGRFYLTTPIYYVNASPTWTRVHDDHR